ncbi:MULTISPECIES: nicotinate phosphoribosyltransferase [Methylomonas]|uniref:nicotinate phosphoribosyltransferase n=1 Tax=Methylomonas TaxID=416 RepID=UPI001232CB63|nr:nicotinate phosphoribosyltransferase [Methylomonas rhizoryzae]
MHSLADNLILNTDSYKSSHYLQYPPGTRYVSSYVESRGGDYPQIVFFGLQMFIKDYLLNPVTPAMVDQAETVLTEHGLPFNRTGWRHIVERHQGYLPLEIQAIPEGMLTEPGQVMMQIVNTDPACFWLTSYLETMLLRAAWYGTTVASRSYACKQLIARYLRETGADLSGLDYKLHDFGARGVSSFESAAIAGLAHLVNFKGTDTLAAVLAAKRYYGVDEMPAFSIPAAEHSTITAWGREREADAYQNMLDRFLAPDKTVAVVSDSYDLWHALECWGTRFKRQIVESGGRLVVRPDSGDPVEVVLQTVQRLDHHFGAETVNGYRLLHPAVRVIQGDGVDIRSIERILHALKQAGYSADNVAFGMGAGLLQKLDRDTLKFAMKASAICIDDTWHDVYKDPVTDPGKQSKRGRLALIRAESGRLHTVTESALGDRTNLLRTVYKNGTLLIEQNLSEIRQRAGLV